MPKPCPEGGLRDFLAEGGPKAAGEGGLAARLAAAVTRARSALPAAAGFAATPAVACIPADTRPERSLALRAAVALGMSAVVVCPVSPSGAMAAPVSQAATSLPASPDAVAAARVRAHAIMSAFTPLTQKMAEELHPDILQVMALARKRSGIEFEIVPGTGGKRTLEMQRALVAKGASKTLTSRHTTGLALDIVPVKTVGNVKFPNFFDKPAFYKVDTAMRAAAAELGVKLTTGLDFVHFQDLGHFELEKHTYTAYEPGSASVKTMVASNGAMPPGGAFAYGRAVDPSPTGRVRVAAATPSPPSASATPAAVTSRSDTTATATPGSGTPSATTPSSVTPRRAPPRGVPDAVGGLRPSADLRADLGEDAPAPRM